MEYIIGPYSKQQLKQIIGNIVKYHIVGKHVTVSSIFDHMMIKCLRFESTCSAYLIISVCYLFSNGVTVQYFRR